MYHKRWRKCTGIVDALAESSCNSEEVVEDNHVIAEHLSDNRNQSTEYHWPDYPNIGSSCEIDSSQSSGPSEHYDSLSDSDDHARWTSDSEVDMAPIDEDQPSLSEQLATWATRNSLTRSSTNEILGILRGHGHNLPKDASYYQPLKLLHW